MSLKLRITLIINLLLLLILAVSSSLTIQDARRNVQAEIHSSEKLALYLFEIGVLKNPKYQTIENESKPFNLQSLVHMRHIKIEFFNAQGKLLDSNASEIKIANQAPDWFVSLLSSISDPWEPKRLPVVILGDHKGDIVISPDPSYEYGEIWNQLKDTLQLIGIFFILINALIVWILSNALNPIKHIIFSLDQLEEGLIDLIKTWQLRHPRIKLQYDLKLKSLPKLNETVSVATYRIIQECLTNISRHAKAKQVNILIHYQVKNKSNRFIDISIDDDGIGFSKSHRDGFGLLGIKERIYEMHGKINIVSKPKLGTRLTIQLPLQK